MKISSLAFADKVPVPLQYTCKGSNISPPFEFIDVPKDAKSLALIVEDLDSSNRWIHWLVYNIPGNVSHFEEGKIPEGSIAGICNSGTRGYEGPCPKYFKGVHRYSFKLFALDSLLDAPAEADAKAIYAAMEGHILESAELVGIAQGEQVTETAN